MADTNSFDEISPRSTLRTATDDILRSETTLKGVDEEELIVHGGRYGLFTPLTKEIAETPDPASQENLARIVEVLRKETSQLQAENLQLKQQLQQSLTKPTRTPDDVMTAISHSVDSLQTRLSQAANPVSDFVIREFTIETQALVNVTALGTIEYRFVEPGDDIDPKHLSSLRMVLAPIPKKDTTGSWNGTDFTPYLDIEDIQGIGEINKQKLNRHNIYTVGDLMNVCTRVRSRVELAALLEVDRKQLDHWLTQAELLTVKGIDARAAEILLGCGIRGLAELAAAEPENLAERYNRLVAERGHAVLKPVETSRVKEWIDASRTYVGTPRDQGTKEGNNNKDLP
jgi:predicted flap endonuclease-1-like 5' DNA nuclease